MITGASSDIIQAFAALVRSEIEDERVDLLRSALTFARIEDPQLDIEDYVRRVDELARAWRKRSKTRTIPRRSLPR